MDNLLKISADDPIMALALKNRKLSLEKEFQQAPAEPTNPRTVLFFAGPPVIGNQGLDAQFAVEAMRPFLEMVKTQYAAHKFGRVGARGPRRDEAEARLFLTGLPRGSFGLELSQPQPTDFLAAGQLSEVLVELTEVLASAAHTDEQFVFALDKVSPRVLPRMKDFLDVVSSNHAWLKIQSGELIVEMTADKLAVARDRVGSTRTTDRPVEIPGTFRGATLDSWRYDFRGPAGETMSGRIGDNVEPGVVEAMLALTNHNCVGFFKEIKIVTRDGSERVRYELLRLVPAASIPEKV
jgi:hypothetical protein